MLEIFDFIHNALGAIGDYIHGGGFVMYPLLALSLAAVVVIVERALAFRRFGAIPSGLLNHTVSACLQGRFDEALLVCESAPGPLAACLAQVIRHRSQPTREIERLVEETGQEYFIRLERLLPVLDTTTTVSPLLGLLGTIAGMIGAFKDIAKHQTGGNTDAVLGGVGEALYATATGLIIAVICFIGYNYYAARLRTITAETEQGTTKLMNALTEQHHMERPTHRHANNTAPAAREGEDHGIPTPTRA